jgi:DNA-binding MarR family transcriptional regulator
VHVNGGHDTDQNDLSSNSEETPERTENTAFITGRADDEVGDGNARVTLELSATDAEALKRILGSLDSRFPASEHRSDRPSARHVARVMFETRKTRTRLFPASMFSEPAWEMLLALFISDEAPAAAELARRVGTPLTTAMRWITYLESHKLIRRDSCSADRRAHRIRLTDRGQSHLRTFLAEFARHW